MGTSSPLPSSVATPGPSLQPPTNWPAMNTCGTLLRSVMLQGQAGGARMEERGALRVGRRVGVLWWCGRLLKPTVQHHCGRWGSYRQGPARDSHQNMRPG